MPLTSKQLTGERGEQLATSWLEGHGYQIMDRNYRKKWGEIDIICRKSDRIHFVEVKTVTRSTEPCLSYKVNADYEPEDNIHPWKLKRLYRAIETYLLDKRIGDEVEWQLDAVSVYLDIKGELIRIDFLEDI